MTALCVTVCRGKRNCSSELISSVPARQFGGISVIFPVFYGADLPESLTTASVGQIFRAFRLSSIDDVYRMLISTWSLTTGLYYCQSAVHTV